MMRLGEQVKKVYAVAEDRAVTAAEKYELRKRLNTSKAYITTAVREPCQIRTARVAERYDKMKGTAAEQYTHVQGLLDECVVRGRQTVSTKAESLVALGYGYLLAVLVWLAILMQDRVPLRVAEGVEWIVGVLTVRGVPLMRRVDNTFLRGHVFRTAAPAAQRLLDDINTELSRRTGGEVEITEEEMKNQQTIPDREETQFYQSQSTELDPETPEAPLCPRAPMQQQPM